ncbi:MAG: sulfatase-like hydrolase/transferase, partial [Rikenellaceae bacterium]
MRSSRILLSAVGCLTVASAAAKQRAERPNILFIIADDASRESIGAYGGTIARTPSIDRIAEQGAIFSNAFTQNPKSCPSR